MHTREGEAAISVIVPVHNRESLLRRALLSIQRQTFADFEVVVVDDGSIDDPASIVRDLRDPRFRIVHQPKRGAPAARNRGAAAATTEWVTFLDSDDEAYPDWLAAMMSGFASGADIVCCGVRKVSEGSPHGRETILLPTNLGPMFGYETGRFTHGGVFALRRTLFASVLGYTETLRSGQHTELAMRLVPRALQEGARIHNIMRPLVVVHVHGGPRIRSNPENIFFGAQYTLEVHRELFRKDPARYVDYLSVAGVCAARIGKVAKARELFWRAVKAQPLSVINWVRFLTAFSRKLSKRAWGTPAEARGGPDEESLNLGDASRPAS